MKKLQSHILGPSWSENEQKINMLIKLIDIELPCLFLANSAKAILTIKLQMIHSTGKVTVKQEKQQMFDMLEIESV